MGSMSAAEAAHGSRLERVTIDGVTLRHNRRQGISVITGRDISIASVTVLDTEGSPFRPRVD